MEIDRRTKYKNEDGVQVIRILARGGYSPRQISVRAIFRFDWKWKLREHMIALQFLQFHR